MKKLIYISGTMLILCIVISLFVYPYLPEHLPIHWNISGSPDNYGHKSIIFLLIPFMTVLNLFFLIVRKIDPRKQNYKKFTHVYETMMLAINLLMFVMFVITITYALNPSLINITLVVNISIGILFMVLGNIMPRIRSNYFIGIRTPWTLHDDQVWAKTNRLSGYLFFLCGFVMMIGAFGGGSISFIILCLTIAVILIIPFLYSYIIYKQKNVEVQKDDRN